MSDSRIEIRKGDITQLDVDAIVNAANTSLAPGGGVCGAIHQAAGPELAAACAVIGGCPTGGARITHGFNLPARYVIHAVGPVWQGGTEDENRLLAAAYRSSLDLAAQHGLRSIAFPAISTGIFGFPLNVATEIAVTTVTAWLENDQRLERVIFSVFNSEAERAYCSTLALSKA